MKKFLQIIGLISLTIFSFFITDKTVTVVNNMDEIMINIKENSKKQISKPIDAVINDNYIIPGIKGKKVNINKSYKTMKKNGYYSEKLYVYDYIKPQITLSKNIDKYIISGNPKKRKISLVFKIIGNDNIQDIVKILNNYDAKSTFFVDETWFNSNVSYIQELINIGHTIAPLFNDYTNPSYEIMDIMIKKRTKKNYSFCYNENENKNNLDACVQKDNYSIKPMEISETSPLVNIKEKLQPGALLSLKINSELRKELSTIIIYIKSKGYTISNIEDNVLE